MEPGPFEAELARVERDADVALKSMASLTRELKAVKANAMTGQVRNLRKALDALGQLSSQFSSSVRALSTSWTFDEQAYLASGDYVREVVELASREGLTAFEQDDRIVSFPSLVRTLPADAAVEIDKVRERRIRPMSIVRLLKAMQTKPPRFKPEQFIESLARAYEFQCAREGKRLGATMRLVDVYEVLTLMPGQAREYSKQEFARDLYLLDQSGVALTTGGRNLTLPASTLTKGVGILTTITKQGQQKLYAGIAFT